MNKALTLLLLLLISCSKTDASKEQNTTQTAKDATAEVLDTAPQRDWQAFSDSLRRAVGRITLPSLDAVPIALEQERLFANEFREDAIPIALAGDSISINYCYPAPSTPEEIQQELKRAMEYNSTTTRAPIHVTISPATEMRQVSQMLQHILDGGFTRILFTGKLALPPLPTVPDQWSYDRIMKKLNEAPAAVVMIRFAETADKTYRWHPSLRRLFDAIANVPESQRIPLFCEGYPALAAPLPNAAKLFTLQYIFVELNRVRHKMQGAGRAFTLTDRGKNLTTSAATTWGEFAPTLFKEEATEIAIILE